MNRSLLALLVLLTACGSNRGGDDDDDVAGDGDADSDGDGDADHPRCLDAAGDPTTDCALDSDRQPCALDDADDCAPVTLVEVWADDGERGPCVRVVTENDCEDTLYSWTCIEHDGAEWQCWLSTTLPGFEVDVSECNATGRWAHYGSQSDGTLDIIHDSCNPDP